MTSVHGVKVCHTSLNCAVNSMVQIRRFKRRFDIDARLKYYTDIFTIQSEVEENTVYCISDGKFGILCFDGIVWCPLEDIQELASRMTAAIKAEIYEIIEFWGDESATMQRLRKAVSGLSW